MKLTFPHIVGYITGVLTFVAGINPALAVAVLGPAVGPYAVPAIAGAGAALVFMHDVGLIPSNTQPAITSIARILPLVLALAIPIAVCLSLSACKTLPDLSAPAAQPYVKAAVDVAVATAEAKGVPAVQINAICKTALAADAGTAATLATVSAVVNSQLVKLNLPAGDLAAAQILEDALSIAIQAQIGANPNVAVAQAAIADVLNAAIAATGG